jgi:hypothetical protein
MTPADRWLIRDAAALLVAHAEELRRSHTVGPKHEWDDDDCIDHVAHQEHDKLMKRAAELRAIADRPR